MRYDRVLTYSDDYLMSDLKDKINMQLQKALANRMKFETLKNMKMWMHRMDNYHQKLKKDEKKAEKTV